MNVIKKELFSTAKWIWAEKNNKHSDLCIFRKTLTLDAKPKRPLLRIAANAHYFLNINNNFIVFKGGLNGRASIQGGYYDEIDVSKYLKKGENAIVVICHYFEGGGYSDEAGLLLELVSGDKVIFASDSNFSVYRNESFKQLNDQKSVNFPGFSYIYDATIERPLTGIYLPSYNSNIFLPSCEFGAYGENTLSQSCMNQTNIQPSNEVDSQPNNIELENYTSVLDDTEIANYIGEPIENDDIIEPIENEKSTEPDEEAASQPEAETTSQPINQETNSQPINQGNSVSEQKNSCELIKNPIPIYAFNQKIKFVKKSKTQKDEQTLVYKMQLPRAMNIFPSIVCKALGMEKIKIYTDRTHSAGDFGEKASYTSPHLEYICKSQKQVFDSFVDIYGEEIYFEVPKTVKISKLGFRYSEYDSEAIASFECSDQNINQLAKKSITTLQAVMEGTILNNVERDRALDLQSAATSARLILKTFDDNGHALVKKTVEDILSTVKDGIICSPGKEENPIIGLLTVSEHGLFKAYCDYFPDLDDKILTATIDYLGKWSTEQSLIKPRGGKADNLYNIDAVVLENCLYYSALNFARALASRMGCYEHDSFFDQRLDGFKKAFEAKFFNGIGYSSIADYSDDRANAFVVLTDLADSDKYELISELLSAVQNASPFMEGFILEALAKMDKSGYAHRRMTSRYAVMAADESSTLGEDFYLRGVQTASRSVMPLTFLLECMGGVKVSKGGSEVTINPSLGEMDFLSFACLTPSGTIAGDYKKIAEDTIEYIIQNDSKQELTLTLKGNSTKPTTTYKITKGKYKYTV